MEIKADGINDASESQDLPVPVARVPQSPHFYERAEFYIAVGALIVSLLSLWLSYLGSPFSSALRPNVNYSCVHIVAGGVGSEPEKNLRVACEVRNPTSNVAEDVIVSVTTGVKAAPKVEVSGGLEYQVLADTGETTIVKFPFLPPESGVGIRIFVKVTPDEALSPFLGEVFLKFVTVHHRGGRAKFVPWGSN